MNAGSYDAGTYTVGAYTVGEEIANSVTHGLGIAAAIVGLTLMLVKGLPVLSGVDIFAVSVYGGSLILMFLFSTLYHALSYLPAKALFKRLDHCAIYLLIAGTYTPLMVISLQNTEGWILLALVWTLAIIGVFFKALYVDRFKRISLVTYLLMGWSSLLVIFELYRVLPGAGFSLLLMGGLCFTFGVIFYVAKSLPFNHAIWHLFVLAGALCHAVTIGVYVIPTAV